MEAEPLARPKLMDELVERWPSLPFMALGLWVAWYALTYSGSVWLSDSEVNGQYLSELFVCSGLGHAALLLAMAVLAARGKAGFASSRRFVLGGGVAAALGCLAVVLVGPYYLGSLTSMENMHGFFVLGALLSGAGTACVGLRCGVLYSSLSPTRVIVYTALSQLVATFVYQAVLSVPVWTPVEHGPAFAGILAFSLLPVAAAALACVRPSRRSGVVEVDAEPPVADVRRIPGSFWRFAAFMFIMMLAMTVMRAAVVTTHALASTQEGSCVIMLFRVALAGVLILYAMRANARPGTMGRAGSLLAVAAAMATACAAALGGLENALSVVIYGCVAVFETLVWCLMAFTAMQKRLDAVLVFGVGRGLCTLGTTVGWALGSQVLPMVLTGATRTVVFFAAAVLMLLISLVLFSERDYERLFSQVHEGELSLGDLYDLERRMRDEAGGARPEKHGRFSQAVEGLAGQCGLSAREAEVLRCLAMGYGSDRIADTLGVKVNTVRAHTHNVYVKLDVHSREELMRLVDDEVARR